MLSDKRHRPVVLAIGGHDPVGGAGIQADIEAIGANGCHAATALTCVTVQDSCNVSQLIPLSAAILSDQCLAVLQDCKVSAIKIGLLGSIEAAETVIKVLQDHPQIPSVFDPVLAAGGGNNLTSERLLDLIRQKLAPLCNLLTPNTLEASRLSGCSEGASVDHTAAALLRLGCQSILITGTHDRSDPNQVINRLYQPGIPPLAYTSPRLAGDYHGSGCTLAAALAARISLNEPLKMATQKALEYSWGCLKNGFRIGRCQSMPNRWHQILQTSTG
jgi:hydroxymethylpyrimidine/phosphomethylpyrimidine kinase